MIFDQLAGIAEAHWPHLMKILHKVRLFEFPARPQDVLKRTFTAEEAETWSERFFLPFGHVAIEDKATCVVMWDSLPNQCGLSGQRYFIDCLPIYGSIDNFREGDRENAEEALASLQAKFPKGAMIVTVGQVDRLTLTPPDRTYLDGTVGSLMVADKHKIHFTPAQFAEMVRQGVSPFEVRAALTNAKVAIEEVLYFNTCERFVVERTPVKPRVLKGRTKGRLLRSHDRPLYTLLTPREAREHMRLDAVVGGRAHPVAHERRRHLRTYSADRYVNVKGKTKVIPATWVGPSEAIVGKHRWKVRLDI